MHLNHKESEDHGRNMEDNRSDMKGSVHLFDYFKEEYESNIEDFKVVFSG